DSGARRVRGSRRCSNRRDAPGLRRRRDRHDRGRGDHDPRLARHRRLDGGSGVNPHFWWYVSRSSGMVAAVLLVMTIVWGLLASTKVLRRPGLPAWIADLHRGLGALTVVFVVVHLTALVGDNTVHFAWTELFVPFASTWRRGPVAWGIAAFWALVVVQGSSLLQRRIGRPTWRRLHYLSYPLA